MKPRRAVAIGLGAAVVALVGVSVWVQREAEFVHQRLGGPSPSESVDVDAVGFSESQSPRALVLYHPSRDAGFSQDLSMAFAEGLLESGWAVERMTLTGETPARPRGYDLIAVVSNTYYWTPDRPTRRYLARARLEGFPVVGIIGGAGATNRSERILGEALRASGAELLETRSFWIFRPNDEERMDEPNRAVALDQARAMGMRIGASSRPGEEGP